MFFFRKECFFFLSTEDLSKSFWSFFRSPSFNRRLLKNLLSMEEISKVFFVKRSPLRCPVFKRPHKGLHLFFCRKTFKCLFNKKDPLKVFSPQKINQRCLLYLSQIFCLRKSSEISSVVGTFKKYFFFVKKTSLSTEDLSKPFW